MATGQSNASQAIAKQANGALTQEPSNAAEIMERVLLVGDLAKLTADERIRYYNAVCQSVGLNPLTRPLEYISLSGKLTLYARKDATDQLRDLKGISITALQREVVEGLCIVTAHAKNAQGRTDMAIGAVPIENAKGEARANAMMKCETKAKRRVTLSICGLGMLDESEVESIPGARQFEAPEPPKAIAPAQDGTDAPGLVEASTNEARGRALIPFVRKYPDGSGYGVTDPNRENIIFSVFKKPDGKAVCSCESTSAFCEHKWAVKLWAAQPPPPEPEPEAIDAEEDDTPQFDEEAHQKAFEAQAPVPFRDEDWAFSKAQRISIFGFCAALEKRGITEEEWRAKMQQIVGVSSRKELTKETAAKVEFFFANWVDSIDAHAAETAQRKGGKAKAK